MQPVIPTPSTVYQPSLSVELEAFTGLNNVRRSLGRTTATWFGSSAATRDVVLPASGVLTVTDHTEALIIVSSGPVTVHTTVNTVGTDHPINTMFVYDATTSGFTITNNGTTEVNVSVRYLIPSS